MNYIESPQEFDGGTPAVFLAGGVSDVENWQARLVDELHGFSLRGFSATVLNPRRTQFPAGNGDESKRQIQWEYRHLRKASLVAFWFPSQTLCPIALFELGLCCASGIPLVVGTDPGYSRRFDLAVQFGLHRPGAPVVDTLDAIARQIVAHPAIRGVDL